MASVTYQVEEGSVPRLLMIVSDDNNTQLASIYMDPLAPEVPAGVAQSYYDALTVKTIEYCSELASNYFNPSTIYYLTEIVNIRKSLFSLLGATPEQAPQESQEG